MPLKYPDYQREFAFEVNGGGLPIAKVITLGNGRWLTVCPLCGCAHDVTTFKGDVYTPNCILKITHPKVYAMWLARFPDASKYSRMMLTKVELADLRKPEIMKAEEKPKRTRKLVMDRPDPSALPGLTAHRDSRTCNRQIVEINPRVTVQING